MFKTFLLPAIMLITGACGMQRKEGSKKVSSVSGANTPVASFADSADNVEATGYYPRMTFETSLSIEYWSSFSEPEEPFENKMALVAGVYPRRTAADSALLLLRRHCPNAFVEKGMLLTHVIH